MSERTHIDETLAEIQRENELRFAYLEGIRKGFEIVNEYPERPGREEFDKIVRNGFREYLDNE